MVSYALNHFVSTIVVLPGFSRYFQDSKALDIGILAVSFSLKYGCFEDLNMVITWHNAVIHLPRTIMHSVCLTKRKRFTQKGLSIALKNFFVEDPNPLKVLQ